MSNEETIADEKGTDWIRLEMRRLEEMSLEEIGADEQ